MSKLCGNLEGTVEDNYYCIPKTSQCPITKITQDDSGNLALGFEAEDGLPILNLLVSEGEGPCVYYKDHYNSAKDKK